MVLSMSRMNDWGIYSRVIFTAIVPVIIFSFVFGLYINNERNQDLLRELTDRGGLIATNLATASEFAVATRNIEQIRSLVDSAMNQKDVIGVRVIDEVGNKLFKRGGYDIVGKGQVSQYLSDIVSTAINDDSILDGIDGASTDDAKLLLGTIEVYISDESYLTRQKSILVRTIIIILSGIIISLGIAMLIGRTLVRPIHDVIDVVSSVKHGDLGKKIDKLYGGELGELQSGINEMSDTISRSQLVLERKIYDATSQLEQTVTELQEKNLELDAARSEAMLAKDAKSEFLANMSHEIRTPLNAIIGFSKQLDKTSLSGNQVDYSKTINSAAHQLLTVIDDILNFSKIESGKLEIYFNEFRLRDCFENVVAMLSHVSTEKEIELVLLIDSSIPDVVIGDEGRLTQVLVNLVNNAIKFTSYGSVVVHISIGESDNDINVSVTDTGCGISLEAQKQLFSPFFQEKLMANKQHGGTGLGLVICMRLITMMGGALSFKSTEGLGSEFNFNIPLEFITMHDCQMVSVEKYAFVLDGNTFSRRAIRNNLVHMGVKVFSADRDDRLIDMLEKHANETIEMNVIVSLPPAYKKQEFFKNIYPRIREYHFGLIVLLVSNHHDEDFTFVDDNILIVDKPVRLSSLKSIYIDSSSALIDMTNNSNKLVNDFKGKNILVAEDNEFNQKYISALLMDMGFTVECVNNGNQAINASKQKVFDIILMDLHMPELNGIDSTKIIRTMDDNLQSIPIIAITADVFSNDNGELIDVGFTDFIFKPIEEDILFNKMQYHLIGMPLNDNSALDLIVDGDVVSTDSLSIPSDFHERLFIDLFSQYSDLNLLLEQSDIESAREKIHTIIGLVGYFKIDDLVESVTQLQNFIRNNRVHDAKILLVQVIDRTNNIQNS